MEQNDSPQPKIGDGSHTTLKAFGFEFSGPTWLAIVFFVGVIFLAVIFGDKKIVFLDTLHTDQIKDQPLVTTQKPHYAKEPTESTSLTNTAVSPDASNVSQGVKADTGSVATHEVGDKDDALKAAKDILTALQQKKFESLWNNQTSEFLKSKTTKDSFLANLTMGRQTFGAVGESKFIDMAYAQTDPTTGYKGEIYAFNYLNAYAIGKFYERIVVVKEKDGKFRLSGLWGSPEQK